MKYASGEEPAAGDVLSCGKFRGYTVLSVSDTKIQCSHNGELGARAMGGTR